MASKLRVPRILDRFANPIAPLASYVTAPFCVAGITFVVNSIQGYIAHVAHGQYSHPNLILFLLPIAILTVLGGRGPGMLTLILSAFSSVVILIEPRNRMGVDSVADAVGLSLMLFTGGLLILGLDFIRRAARIQTSVTEEYARLHERAQRIASAFQEPLFPRIPHAIAGLEIAHYYKPALDEAAVGGDFLDVFQTERGDTVLVLGDISGKGLTAATQISTVRSMLRFALHRKSAGDLAAVLGDVNDAMASQELLAGFATLFVGMYETESSLLTYVSCGHEPAFIKPAGGRSVEELPPTGPILGPFAGARYQMQMRTLDPGDTLVVYTDGLSDSGPDRARMLGGIGLKQLLAGAPPDRVEAPVDGSPQNIADHIIEGTRTHAEGRLSDDACLLVCTILSVDVQGRREPTSTQSAPERTPAAIGSAKQ